MKNRTQILEAKDLSIGYKNGKIIKQLVGSVNIKASNGELVALIGPNGSGKSTLLRTIAGLHYILDGEILIQGGQIYSYSISDMARLVSFVSAASHVSQNLSIIELVSLGRFPYTNWIGKLRDQDVTIIKDSIAAVGLTSFTNKKIGELSDGEKQRAMIARALAQDTNLLILDEPTAFLDLPNRYELIHILKDLVDNKSKTVIFSTHDLQVALKKADKIWLITENRLFEGASEDLILNGSMANLFPGSSLVFDENEGGFIYPSETVLSVRFEGYGLAAELTKKVFSRLNIGISEEGDIPAVSLSGDAPDTIWDYRQDNLQQSFRNLYELSLFLKDMIEEKKRRD